MKKMMILGAAMVMCCVSTMASGGEDGNFFESLWNRLFSDKNSVSMENSKSSPHEHQWYVISTINDTYRYSFFAEVGCGQRIQFFSPSSSSSSSSSSSPVTLFADSAMVEMGMPVTITIPIEKELNLDLKDGLCYDQKSHAGQGNGCKSALVYADVPYENVTRQCTLCQVKESECTIGDYTDLKAKIDYRTDQACTGKKITEGGDD